MQSYRSPCITVVGAGGLGVPAAWGVVSSGASTSTLHLHIIDYDVVALENLHRQVLYQESDIGKPKAECLTSRLKLIAANMDRSHSPKLAATDHIPPFLQITHSEKQISAGNIHHLLANSTVVIDATDSVEAKLLINDYCLQHSVSYCYGGSVGTVGQLLSYDARSPGGCLRCLFGELSLDDIDCLGPTCHQAGILGPAVGMAGFALAGEALRLLAPRIEDNFQHRSRFLRYELTTGRWTESAVARSSTCEICSHIPPSKTLNLKTQSCPKTFLLTKLAAETLSPAQELYVQVDSQKIGKSVAESIAEEGYIVPHEPWENNDSSWELHLRQPENR